MIREAKRQDVPQLVELSRAANKDMNLRLPWDAEAAEVQLRNLMILPNGILLVWEESHSITGVIGGPLIPWPFDLKTPTVQEYIVSGHHIEELRHSFYEEAETRGARAVIKLCVDPSEGPRTAYLKGGHSA